MMIIEPRTITAMLVEWLEDEPESERKAIALTPKIIALLERERTLGQMSKDALTDYVLQVLCDAYTLRVGLPSVQIVSAERRDTLREN